MALPLSGGVKAYAGLSHAEALTKQAAVHMLGTLAHQKIALNLDPTGETPWQVIRSAGGSAAFAVCRQDSSPEGRLVGDGSQQAQASITVASTAVVVIYTDTLQAEAAAFARILSKSGKMSPAQIQEWQHNPPVSLSEKKSDALMMEIKLAAVRAVATESVGGSLDDKEWRTLASLPEWLAWQKPSHQMPPALAMQLDTQIFSILNTLPLERAKQNTSRRIVRRAKSKSGRAS